MYPINAAKLTTTQVQQIRALHAAGFSTRTIAESFGVVPRTVADIIHQRSWAFLPIEPVELPVLATDAVTRLRLRTATRLTTEQRQVVDAYRRRLAEHIEQASEREGLASRLLSEWTPRRPRGRRETVTV